VEPKEHWKSKAEELKKVRKFEEAVKIMNKVKEIERSDTSEDYWYEKANNLYEIGEYEQAKDALFKDLEVHQKSYNTFFLLGKILYELKIYEDSLEYLNKASEEHDSKILKNIQKIDQMKTVSKFEEAVMYSDKVKQDHPLDSRYWFQRGLVLFQLGKFSDAVSCFNSSLENPFDLNKIQYQLAKSELFAGNPSGSFDILEKICTVDPNNKEKLRLDKDFETVLNDKRFRIITNSLP
jgi:tetratricopeptide (TPR) repeat protein